MAGSLGTLTLDLIAKIGGFTGPMDQAGRMAKKASKEMTEAANQAASAWSALGPIAAGAVAAFSVSSIFGQFITETRNAEQEQAQLSAALRSTGESAGFNRDQLNEMADAMQRATTFSGGDINQAQTTLLAFTGIVGTQFNRALQSAADMATRTGSTVKAAAEIIGRALDVPSQGLTALSKQGFRFTDEQKKLAVALESTGDVAGAQQIILKALEESYGGAAKAARDTFGGSLDALQNTISGLLTGEGSLGGATDAINALNDALSAPEAKEALNLVAKAAVVLAGVLTVRLAAAAVSTAASFVLAQVETIRYQAALARMAGVSTAAATGLATLSASARAASAAMTLLGGPVGVLIAAGAALTYFVTKTDSARQSLVDIGKPLDEVIEKFKQLGRDQKAAQLSEYTADFEQATKDQADAYSNLMRQVNRDLGSSLFPRLKAEFDEAYSAGLPLSSVIEDLARRFQLKPEVLAAWVKQAGAVADAGEKAGYAADLVKRLTDEFNSNAAAASSSATAVVEKSKVYTEMSKKIQEQILLAGKRTEADKLAARIKAGLVEGLKEGEGELLIADQKRADAAIKAAEATKKAEDSAKASAKSAAEALIKRGVDAEENYRRQIELINESANKQNKATEVAKLAFELESGKLKGVSADRQKVLKDLAAELDAKIKLQKQNENDIKLAAFSANLKDSNTIVRQGFELELSGAGSGDRLKERLKADLEIQQDYAKQSSELFKQLNAGDISQELYDKETEMLSEALAERMVLQQDYYNQLDADQGNWMDGMGDAWNNYLDQSRDISGQTKTLFTEAFSGMNDALYNFVTTGKLSFSDLAATAASSVLRMLIQWGTAQVAMAALNAFTSTAAIPVVGPLAAPAAAASAMGSAGSFMSMISSVAGMAHDGIDSIPEDGTWFLQKGERVTTAETSAKLDRTLDQVAQKGGPGGNNIAIHNYAPAQVETRQEGDQLKIFIREAKRAIAGDLANGNGEITRVLTGGYGMRRVPR
ncbi:tail protein [Pseudomonas helleri]|uniref:phage tail tape measure protein n=1 Tax=Pseudomonas helleri TaxID=1608996 RepID=UPI000653B150|nr:phage tail tape measure protein [Pseudomonas helleri]KMN24327.1 tail protein [Pseudomonas helleri]